VIQIAPLQEADRAAWDPLARGYHGFYESVLPDARYEETWRLLMADERIHGLAARLDGRIVGIAHYFFHPQTWSADACYLQDLFTAETARGRGVATALIEHIAEVARARGASKFYWMTKQDNVTARALYDRIARFKGFVRYDLPL
jgi:GNAT superfamily N-acetyltransferase